MAFYDEKRYTRALESNSVTPNLIADMFEGIFREELSARANGQPRDPDNKFVSRRDVSVRCGIDDDEPDPRPVLPLEGRRFIPCDQVTLADMADAALDTYTWEREEDVYDEDDPEAELAAWCRANRRLCVPFDWSTQGFNLPRAPRPWSPRSLRRSRRTRPVQVVTVGYID